MRGDTKRNCTRLTTDPEWTLSVRSALRTASPYVLNGLLAIVYLRADVLILAVLATSLDVSTYEAGALLIVRGTVAIQMLTNIAMPVVSRAFDRRVHLAAMGQGLGVLALCGGLLLAVPFMVFGQSVVDLLFGDGFGGSGAVLATLAVLVPLKFMANVVATILTACDLQLLRTRAVALAAITNVALNVIFIPIYGLWAAVWSTLFTEAILLVVLLIALDRVEGQTFYGLRDLASAAIVVGLVAVGLVAADQALVGGLVLALFVAVLAQRRLHRAFLDVRTFL